MFEMLGVDCIFTGRLPPDSIKLLFVLTLLHSERPKLYAVLAFLNAIELNVL